MGKTITRPGILTGLATLALLTGCGGGDTAQLSEKNSESCMFCHNVSFENDYAGPGIENPHPFGTANNLLCTTCHGGHGDGEGLADSHVPPPPEIGDETFQTQNHKAYFNRLTLTGIDTFPDYEVDGVTYTALDYLQFINPGDLRVTEAGMGCGQCHAPHSDAVAHSLLATSAGILSGATYAIGADNQVPESQGDWVDTAADLAFRAIDDPTFDEGSADVGEVSRLLEYPVISQHPNDGPGPLHNNPAYYIEELEDDVSLLDGKVVTGSALADLYHEQIAFTCGDCHLGSAGANNRSGDYRSSGCTACHMPYSLGGRSYSKDPNINKFEPVDPDDIDEPERAHVRTHQIVSIAKQLPSGQMMQGIDDYACAGCHQGSNRTVMQYWGIRLDQNRDVHHGNQYPDQPASYQTTFGDTRLFDPALGNKEFNGRDHRQYLLEEDYDGDGRDDTPPDVHYEAGMGCIDCHGSWDLHGGSVTAPDGHLASRMEQTVSIRCEDCHGTIADPATTVAGTTYAGEAAQVAVDSKGNPLRHVTKEGDHYYLTSRLTGAKHFLPQIKDLVVDTGATHPDTGQLLFSPAASFAMGRPDGSAATGIGPLQTDMTGLDPNFSHTDRLDCATCHASWTNTCMGCHLEGEYNGGQNFSNITGERIVFREKFADFVYQTPVPFQLGVNSHGEIAQFSANTKTFFRYNDNDPNKLPEERRSQVYHFSDRNGQGSNPGTAFPSLSHNAMMAHSIRGRNTTEYEGARQCVACHLTDDGLAQYGALYDSFRTAIASRNYTALDYGELVNHIGLNTGNDINSPLWVHMVAGLGSGLFLFDDQGRAMNPLDDHTDRKGTDNVPPTTLWTTSTVALDLDRIVEPDGTPNGSNNHPMLDGPSGLRDGAEDTGLAGPLGATLIEKLTDPVTGWVLDSWVDADGTPNPDAQDHMTPP